MLKKLTLSILFIFSFTFTLLKAQISENDIHDIHVIHVIHAIFIINFIKYIEFPDNSNMSIGVIDNLDVYESFKTKINSSKIILKNIFTLNDVENYKILYLPKENNHLLFKILEKIKNKKILLITESPNNVNKGASISFKVVNERMKFQMNKPLMESMGYKIDNSIYSLAIK